MTSAPGPLPRDRRRVARTGRVRRAAAGPAAAERERASRAHAVSRVTVRKALELLRDEGLIDARQGFGWFVAADPVRQTLGRLGTIEDQLASSG